MCALESSKQQAFSCCVALFYVVSLVGSKKQKFLPLALPLLLFPLPESFLIINRSSWRRLPVDCELKTFTATSHCVLGGRAIELPADVAAPTCRQGIIDALREQINSSSSPFFITWTPREESGLRCKIELDWIPIGFPLDSIGSFANYSISYTCFYFAPDFAISLPSFFCALYHFANYPHGSLNKNYLFFAPCLL